MIVRIDFVARGEIPGEWRLVLVEEGPWTEAVDEDLRRIQERLYGALDAALEGAVAEQFPESTGQRFVIQLDSYDGPDAPLTEFFNAFANGVLQTTDYERALSESRFVSDITFELNVGTTKDT